MKGIVMKTDKIKDYILLILIILLLVLFGSFFIAVFGWMLQGAFQLMKSSEANALYITNFFSAKNIIVLFSFPFVFIVALPLPMMLSFSLFDKEIRYSTLKLLSIGSYIGICSLIATKIDMNEVINTVSRNLVEIFLIICIGTSVKILLSKLKKR